MTPTKNPFVQDWQACLWAHLLHVAVVEPDPANEKSLRGVLGSMGVEAATINALLNPEAEPIEAGEPDMPKSHIDPLAEAEALAALQNSLAAVADQPESLALPEAESVETIAEVVAEVVSEAETTEATITAIAALSTPQEAPPAASPAKKMEQISFF
jgi:hypothetical protein